MKYSGLYSVAGSRLFMHTLSLNSVAACSAGAKGALQGLLSSSTFVQHEPSGELACFPSWHAAAAAACGRQ